MRVVGSAVFAAFSMGGGSSTDLGTGAAVAARVLSQPNPPSCGRGTTCYNFFLLRYQPGTDLPQAATYLQAAVTRAGCPKGLCPCDWWPLPYAKAPGRRVRRRASPRAGPVPAPAAEPSADPVSAVESDHPRVQTVRLDGLDTALAR